MNTTWVNLLVPEQPDPQTTHQGCTKPRLRSTGMAPPVRAMNEGGPLRARLNYDLECEPISGRNWPRIPRCTIPTAVFVLLHACSCMIASAGAQPVTCTVGQAELVVYVDAITTNCVESTPGTDPNCELLAGISFNGTDHITRTSITSVPFEDRVLPFRPSASGWSFGCFGFPDRGIVDMRALIIECGGISQCLLSPGASRMVLAKPSSRTKVCLFHAPARLAWCRRQLQRVSRRVYEAPFSWNCCMSGSRSANLPPMSPTLR